MIEPALTVRQPSSSYPVFIRHGLIDRLDELVRQSSRASAAVVLTSAEVAHIVGPRLAFAGEPILVPDGESAKTLEVAQSVISAMLERGLQRDTVLVAVGGGSVGDLGGFVASVFLRGIDVIQVPTTLLAMLDSSIGGKTGVNHPAGKNLIGTIWPPRAVISDLDLLVSMPERQLKSGLLEALKCGVIADPALFGLLESGHLSPGDLPLGEIVRRAVAVKASVIEHDERDADARRLLNYGHTIGHGLEAALGFSGLTHGEAVGWGMIAANAVATRLGLITREAATAIDAVVRRVGIPPLGDLDAENVMEAIEHDKKFAGGRRVMVLPRSVGECEVVKVERSDVEYGVAAILAR